MKNFQFMHWKQLRDEKNYTIVKSMSDFSKLGICYYTIINRQFLGTYLVNISYQIVHDKVI